MSAEISVEATGETVGEAKWAAMRELEARMPGLDRSAVRFQVVSEGERGLLGVGYAPARVLAAVDAAGELFPSLEPPATRDAAVAAELVERTIAALEVSASVRVEDDDDEVVVTVAGPDVGVLIGRHGQTLDALQVVANALARRADDGARRVIVDGAGYRDRRAATLTALARDHAGRASALGERVALEPMSAAERRVVHESLADDPSVDTTSEGSEPYRHVVIVPRRAAD